MSFFQHLLVSEKVLYVSLWFSFLVDTQNWMISTALILNRSLSVLLLMMALQLSWESSLYISPQNFSTIEVISKACIPASELAICLGKALEVQRALRAHLRSESLFLPLIIIYFNKNDISFKFLQLSVPQPT